MRIAGMRWFTIEACHARQNIIHKKSIVCARNFERSGRSSVGQPSNLKH